MERTYVRCYGSSSVRTIGMSDYRFPGYEIEKMQTKSDTQLLREYAEHRSESAFSEIVARHTDMVYCAATRQLASPDLARDVAQRVFTALAQAAGSLSTKMAEDASVAGWLYRTTRNTVLNFRRDEYRRHQRERQAMQDFYTGTETSPDWNYLSPILDEAMGELNEADHDALLLRYFKNEDLQAVGRALGVSDDAAQKRVSRAIERLREFFVKRGITVATGSLAAAISANAATAAPVGLATSISAAAVLTAQTAGTVVVAKTTLTTLNFINMKSLAAIGAALAVGTSTYLVGHSQVNRIRAENEVLKAAHEQAGWAVRRAEGEGGYRTQSGHGMVDPGFFSGIAGIGYTLLRLAHSESLPSVLLWG